MMTVRVLEREDSAIQSLHVGDGGPGKLSEGPRPPDGTKQTKNQGTGTVIPRLMQVLGYNTSC